MALQTINRFNPGEPTKKGTVLVPLSRSIATSSAGSADGRFPPLVKTTRGFPAFTTPAPQAAQQTATAKPVQFGSGPRVLSGVTAATVKYTDEQQAVIQDQSDILVVKAFAGTGKTTTAVGYAAARPNSKILYVAFGKPTQLAAKERFGANVDCRTTHSLAYATHGRAFSERLVNSWRAMTVREQFGLQTNRQAAIAQALLNKFFHSDDASPKEQHASDAEVLFHAEGHEIDIALQNAKKMWARIQDKNDRVSVPPDAYLKMWSLSNPKLNFDCILFDEAQDSNPVTAHVIRQQTHANLLYIGDPHQSIYGFRGAKNAMSDFKDATHLNLTQTWRFGEKTARIANLLLQELKGEKASIVGMGTDVAMPRDARITKLARTNAQLFRDAIERQGEGVHWVGGVDSYQLNKLLDAYNLYANRRDTIADPFIRGFSSWNELVSYAEDAKDPEARAMRDVVDEYRHNLPDLLTQVKDNACVSEADASLILTTAHKAKGLDWDYVQLSEDFELLKEIETDLAKDPFAPIDEQEVNLLYVAATRAKKQVHLNKETKDWIHDLPMHRQARQSAIASSARKQRQGANLSPARAG
jgi:F-box protein 18 (helicase)